MALKGSVASAPLSWRSDSGSSLKAEKTQLKLSYKSTKPTPEKSLQDKGRTRQRAESRKGRKQQVGKRWEFKKNARERFLVRLCPLWDFSLPCWLKPCSFSANEFLSSSVPPVIKQFERILPKSQTLPVVLHLTPVCFPPGLVACQKGFGVGWLCPELSLIHI